MSVLGGMLLAACLSVTVLLSALRGTEARWILVGNSLDPVEPWTQIGVNYTQWAADNPLYVGDVAVFKYRPYYHVVWQLPDISDFDNCVYDRALFIGNDTAGANGFPVNVTDTPKYLACGVFGHCELGQKVIINGSLGPLPASLYGVDVPPPSPPAPPAPPASPALPPLVLSFPPFGESASAPPPTASAPAPSPYPPPAPAPPGCPVCTCPATPPPTASKTSDNTPPPPAGNSGGSLVPPAVSALMLGLALALLAW